MELAPPPDSGADRIPTNPDTPAAIAAARSSQPALPTALALPAAPPAPPPPRAPLISTGEELDAAAREAGTVSRQLRDAMGCALDRLKGRGARSIKPRIPSGRYPVPAVAGSGR